MQSIHNQLAAFREKGRRFKKWKNIVTALACVVVFCTVYALILPAITLEGDTYCGLEEHTHSEECYTKMVTSIEKKLVCTQEEVEPHTHTAACYASAAATTSDDSGVNAADTEAEAATTSETTEDELICGKVETEGHTHGDSCYEEVEVYGEDELTCTQEEHEHSKACYSNPDADVETEAEWMKTFEDVTFTNDWVADTIAIAKTQIGYTESTENYEVTENGDTKGYTRYGEWYGNKYGDWCAMFVSFCLNYAEVEDFPLEASCQNWIEALQQVEEDSKDAEGVVQYNAYQEASEDYIPSKGNLIFFNWDDEADSDHVGLIVNVETDENNTTTITTIEGNASDVVKYKTYELDNKTIMGYGILPEQEFYCEMEGHAHDDDCYNDANELICTIEEHIHTDECSEQGELTKEEQAEVDAVIAAIDALPTVDEFEEKLEEYETVEDMEGYEAYWVDIRTQGAKAYAMYEDLSELQKSYVTNIDKLMDLEWLWSATTYNGNISSATPTTTWYTSTKDFVELNLYDYNGNVNTYWSSSTKYPGFQWNGGAYSKSDYQYGYSYEGIGVPYIITDRNRIDSIDFGNSLITNLTYGNGTTYAKSVNATDVAKSPYYYSSTSPINWIYGNDSEGYTNKPIGVSTTDTTQSQKVMSYTLNDDGYPQLANGISLEYLFTENSASKKLNTESIDGLFQRDDVTGEYRYNSRTNHAQYTNNFFQLYNQIITPNFITYPFGNFLPLNTISDSSKATQVGAFNYAGGMSDYVEKTISDLKNDTEGLDSYWTKTQNQLVTMLEEYKENWNVYPRTINGTSNKWSNLSPANAIRDYFWGDTDGDGDKPSSDTSFITQEYLNSMYNIDWDVQTNFFFGMEMKMNFMMPKGGMTGNDTNGDGESDYPMVFEFTGDDDVWVYIDDVLFLDLSGIHRHVGGKIDFVNGKVYYYQLQPSTTGDVSESAYKTYTFAEILKAAGKDTSVLNSNGTFTDYSTHAFNFYYMERGSGSSVCRLNFNFPLLKRNSISVSKQNVPNENVELVGNPDYYFNIVNANNELFVGPSSVTGVMDYTILDSGGNVVGTGQTDEYGIFTLKAGQTAVFEGIEEDSGKFFVQELIKEEDHNQYNEAVTVNGQGSRYNSLINWSYRKYFSDTDNDNYTGPYGYKWYGHSGADTDSSTNSSFYFEAINGVKTEYLRDLSITKKVEEYGTTTSSPNTTYKMYVELDGSALPVGTEYLVGSETKKVTEEGYIEIAAGETATIENILSGTEFKIKEAEASAKGYTVAYSATNADEVETDGASITGVVRTGADVTVLVTNNVKGAGVTINGIKTVKNPDGEKRTFEFTLQEVTNSSGNTIKTDGTSMTTKAEVSTADPVAFEFVLNYLKLDESELPLTYYYKITETTDKDDVTMDYDESSYVVEVTVQNGESGIVASVTKVWKDGTLISDGDVTSSETTPVKFVNEQLYQLSIAKTIDGVAHDGDEEFEFSITLKNKDGDPLTGEYSFLSSNSSTAGTAKFDENGTFTTIKVGETITIIGLPYGITWDVTETDTEGYNVFYKVGTDGDEIENKTSTGTLDEDTLVTFINQTAYELPETGGIGTTPFIIGGMSLMLGALFYNKKRRKEEEASS